MVILFKGTDKSKNNAPQAMALCAGLSATKYLKKTLVMQVTTKYPVENYLIGKKLKDQFINNTMYLFEDTGMDSLTRRAGITSFNADHFANAVIPAVSSENLFDLLEVSKKVETDVEREIISDPTIIGTIIKSAKKIYDNIFILANGKSKEVVEQLLPYVDKTVTCVAQGIKEDISAKASDKHLFLVTDYDYKSTYSATRMKKIYDSKKIFIMPYNVEFKDYYTNKEMLQYILHNTNPEKSDYSYHLIDEISKLTRVLIEDEEYEEDEYRFSNRTFERCINKPVVLSGDNCQIEVTEKKFLRPSKTLVHVNTKDPFVEQMEEKLEMLSLSPKELKKKEKLQKKEEKKQLRENKKLEKAKKKEDKRNAALEKSNRKKAKKEEARIKKREKEMVSSADLERKEA